MENPETTSKKISLDDLTKEELINKCRGLLALAQKAKQAKTELQKEVESYKLALDKCETEKKSGLDSLQTLQELVDSLTEQKLNYITDLDVAQSKISGYKAKCDTYEDELKQYKSELAIKDKLNIEIAQKLSDIDIEIISLKRQNNRLLEENEQLINQLTELETRTTEFNNIGLQQREQLQILEQKVQSDELYKTEIEKLNNVIKDLENKLKTASDKDHQNPDFDNKIKDLTQQYEAEKTKNEKANIKLRSYKDKILKCAACINQLKNSRFILTKTVKEYSENIPKWRNDIIKASKVLEDQINSLNEENKTLKEKLEQLEKQADDTIENEKHLEIINSITAEKYALKCDLNSLQTQLQDIMAKNTTLESDNNSIQLELSELEKTLQRTKSEKDMLYNELLEFKTNVSIEYDTKNNTIKELTKKNNDLTIQVNKLNTKIKELNEANENLNISLQSNSENNTLESDNNSIKSELSELEKTLQRTKSEKDMLYNELLEFKTNVSIEYDIKNNTIQELTKKNNDLIIQVNKLHTKIKELNEANENLNISLQSNSENNDVIDNLNLQIKSLESEKAILVREKLNARDNVVELENQNRVLSEQLNNFRSEAQVLKNKVETLTQEKETLQKNYKTEKEGETNNFKCIIMSLQEQYDLLKKEHDNLQDLNGLLKEEVETLKLSLEQPNDDSENLSDLNVSLQADIVKLETKLAAYKQENASLLVEVKESRAKIKEFDSLVAEYEDMKSKMTSYKTENTELLHEMKEINQVLKERGEAISKLQKAVAEMERLIETLEKDRDKVNQEKEEMSKKIVVLENDLKNAETKTSKTNEVSEHIVEERDQAIKALAEKEESIAALRDEIEKLKQQQTSSDLPNDDMSTSTISKAEEHSRMKDLDESFEEKYTKLRIFALKLKKKLNETTAQLQNAEEDKARLEKLLKEQDKDDVKIISPKATDHVDGTSNDGDGDGLKGDIVTELQSKLKSLTAALEATEKISLELAKVKAEHHSKTEALDREIEAHKVTKEQLEKARRDVKKKNVLSLEMEDYERSMKELTMKMEDNKKKIVQMESTIDTQEGTITAMKTQIKLLEEQVKAEETQSRLLKEELHNTIEGGREKDNIIESKNNIISKLEQDLEDEKRKNEEADLEMTSVLSEKEKVIMNLADEKVELNNKLKKLEFKCAELNESLRITNIELSDLKTEYTSYKVRAQAVLRQNQTVDHSQEEQLKEDNAALRAQIETLTAKLTSAQEQLSEQASDIDASRRRVAEAISEAARAQQRNARLQADLTKLGQQIESERTQHKLQVSTLTQCYKTQITDLEAKLQKETEALKKQLIAAQDNVKVVKIGSFDEDNHNHYMLPVIPKEESSDGEMDINVSMIPREEGEGSESAPSPPLSKPYMVSAGGSRSPVPLDRLLEEGVPEDEALDTSSLGLTPEQEISDLRRKLQAQQQRVKHVTVLLSESERECARMAQLSELLKAELRRVRGTNSNTHNTEYMKNVTLKFLTLPPGDERSRLVPVLQKILTLTPDESQKIQAIAKGLDPNPSKGWGSYLPWPGGK